MALFSENAEQPKCSRVVINGVSRPALRRVERAFSPLCQTSRNVGECVEIKIVELAACLDVLRGASSSSCKLAVSVKEFEIIDRVARSPINKIVSYWLNDEAHPRESGSSMLRFALDIIRTQSETLSSELRLRVAILPLRINLDQDTLEFLMEYTRRLTSALGTTLPTAEDVAQLQFEPTFFQSACIRALKIKLDYWPKRVDFRGLREGELKEVVNIFAYEALEIVLKRVHLGGVHGWSNVIMRIMESWVSDVTRKQLHKCLAGVSFPPIKTAAAVGGGLSNLVLLPIEEFQRGGSVLQGLRRGSKSCFRTIALEALSSAAAIAETTTTMLKAVDGYLDPESSGEKGEAQFNPRDAQQGIDMAAQSLSRAVKSAVQTIVAIPLKEYQDEEEGTQRVKSIVRAVPICILKPMLGATAALTHTVQGVHNQIDPEHRHDAINKYAKYHAAC